MQLENFTIYLTLGLMQLKRHVRQTIPLESCKFCHRVVIDDAGNKTEEYGSVKNGRHMCIKCTKAFEFSIGH